MHGSRIQHHDTEPIIITLNPPSSQLALSFRLNPNHSLTKTRVDQSFQITWYSNHMVFKLEGGGMSIGVIVILLLGLIAVLVGVFFVYYRAKKKSKAGAAKMLNLAINKVFLALNTKRLSLSQLRRVTIHTSVITLHTYIHTYILV